jgi:hypothetical protein
VSLAQGQRPGWVRGPGPRRASDAATRLSVRARPASLTAVRLTAFWERMNAQFGAGYAGSVAKDFVIAGLGSRTVNQALADGEDIKVIWRAVCEAFHLPDRVR